MISSKAGNTVEVESFGRWLRHRRRELDLTQDELARQIGCARITIRKIEADQLHPSKQLAELLCEHLGVPADEREHFVRSARKGVVPKPVTASETRDNLPHPISSFIGRQHEIAEVKRLISLYRLVTLTGAGGCGKSRLAIATARQLLDSFRDGVWLAAFAPLSDPLLVHQTIASALRVHEEPGRPLIETLCLYLRSKSLLLVFDNCEHLIEECARTAETLLQACPHLHILATSREALDIPGEERYYVPCLSLPDAGTPVSVESLKHCEAVDLFVDRAVLVQPAFGLTVANANSVVQICRRLDGMPLAIELAAARVKVLSVQHIAEHLDDRFSLLTSGNRTALPRHQTLRATIEWSYQLLPEKTRMFFRRLAVFVGGFTQQAAQSVCSDENFAAVDALSELSRLVDRSLVELVQVGDDERYRLLETFRQYAREQLMEGSEEDRCRDRHLEYFTEWIEKAEPKLRGPEQLVWWDRVEIDHDNIRAALEWSMSGGDAQLGLRLAGAAYWFWVPRGYWREGLNWLKSTLRSAPAQQRTSVRAKALVEAHQIAVDMYTIDPVDEWCAEGLGIWEELGDNWWISHSLQNIGWHRIFMNDIASATQLLEKSVAYARSAQDEWMLACALRGLGAATERFDYAAANRILEESLSHAQTAGDRVLLAHLHKQLASVALGQSDYARAAAFAEESVRMFREVGGREGIAECMLLLGAAVLMQGNSKRARQLCQDALRLADSIGPGLQTDLGNALVWLGCVADAERRPHRALVLLTAGESLFSSLATTIAAWPWDYRLFEESMASARAQLGDDGFNKAVAQGRAMSAEQAIKYALQTGEEDELDHSACQST